MSYFTLPNMLLKINPENLKLEFITKSNYQKQNNVYINESVEKYLKQNKEKINEHYNEWDNYKKYTNQYEFIHSVIPYVNRSVANLKPISRAFYKLVELYKIHRILDNLPKNINTFHLAEGPGGFIEATAYLRKNKLDNYYGISLIEENNSSIPGWNKMENVLNTYKNIYIEEGVDKKGDLYNYKNLLYCTDHYNKMDIITADGGIDFSIDFNEQENMAVRLIFTQVLYALLMQKKNGHFILKMFDIFLKPSVDILFILSCFYKKIYVTKPNTSRSANSEKYIICKYFKYDSIDNIKEKCINILKIIRKINFKEYYIRSIINIDIPYNFKNQLQELNTTLGVKQIENIRNTIKLINMRDNKKEKIQYHINNNIEKCIYWCKKYDIPYNINAKPKNIFNGISYSK